MSIVKILFTYFNRTVTISILLLFSIIGYAQEICNNGIDDNGNGLIDLNDTAGCTCTVPAPSLIPNASFEQTNCCPSSFSQLNCAQGWIQASSATSDYMNSCGFVFPAATAAGLMPPPDGNGMAGLISSIGYQEYIGACLTSPMLKDTAYSIQLSIASTPIDGWGNVCNGGVISYSPSDIVIYGSTNCANLPFSGQGCPPSPQWQILGSALYTPVNSWGTITINFTPTVNINTIIIGSPCTLPASYTGSPCYPYFYFDNLFLNKSDLVNSITQTGSWCAHTTILTGDSIPGAAYQWYLNGIAIVGETSLTLNVSADSLPAGNYTLATTVGSNCNRATATVVPYNNPPVISPAGPFCYYDPATSLTANMAGGIWGGTGITDTVNGVFDPAMANVGNNYVFYTLPGGGDCPRADTITIIVKGAPPSAAGPDITICSGEVAYIGGSPVAGYFYSWTPSTGLSSASASNPSVTLINNDTVPMIANYSLITTDAATGCQGLDQLVITVNPKPSINPAGPFCKTEPATNLAASIAGGTWSGTGITNTSTGSFNPASAAVGDNEIIYTVAGTCAGGDTAIITVLDNPVSNAGADIAVCSGTPDTIGTSPVTGNTYSWTPTTGLSNSTVANPAITTINNGTTPLITTYTVTTSAAGCQTSDVITVTVNPQPSLVITNPSAVCSPAVVDITAPAINAGTSGGGVLSYWLDSLSNNAITTPAAIATGGTYYIKSTAAGACTEVKPVIVTINLSPVSDAGADISLCTGDTGQIGSNAIPGSTYSWLPATGLITDTASNPFIAVINSGSAPQIIEYIVTTAAGGCSSTDTVNVTVNILATANAGIDRIVCAGSDVPLNGVIGGAAANGLWNGGAGMYSPGNNSLSTLYSPDTSEISAGSVTLTLTSDDPPGTCPVAVDTIVITINLPAIVNAGTDDTICAGNTVALNAVIGGTATGGAWSGGGGTYNPDNTSLNAIYTPGIAETEAGIVNLTYTTDDPSGPCPAVSDVVTVYINMSPTANAGSAQYVCEGTAITLNGSVGGSATSAAWSGGTGTFSPDNTALDAVYTPAANEYSADSIVLTLTTNNPIGFPCTASSSDVTVHFYKKPVINFSVDDSAGCPLHCVNFTDSTTVANGSSITNYSWNFGDNSTVSNISAPSHCYSQTGWYDVTLTVVSDNNCSDTLTIPQIIQVYPLPSAEFEYSPDPATIISSTITLNDLSSQDVNLWFWDFGDGDTMTVSVADIVHEYPGDYPDAYLTSLIVMNLFGCTDTVIHQIVINPEFSFFAPNAFSPNGDGLNDYFGAKGMGIEIYELMIFDRWGNLIFYSDELDKTWDGKANQGAEKAQQDTYVWKVKLTDVYRKKHNYIGTVSIIR